MSSIPSQSGTPSEQKPVSNPGSQSDSHSLSQSSVEVRELIGTVFLGILSVILTFTLLHALNRNRKLEVQLARLEKSEPRA